MEHHERLDYLMGPPPPERLNSLIGPWKALGDRTLKPNKQSKAMLAMDAIWQSLGKVEQRQAWDGLLAHLYGAPSLAQARWMVGTGCQGAHAQEALVDFACMAVDRVGSQGEAEEAFNCLMSCSTWTVENRSVVLDRLLKRSNPRMTTSFMEPPRTSNRAWAQGMARSWIQQGVKPSWQGAGCAMAFSGPSVQPLVDMVLEGLRGAEQETWAGAAISLLTWLPDMETPEGVDFLPQRLRQMLAHGMPWTLHVSHAWTQAQRAALEQWQSAHVRGGKGQKKALPWLRLYRKGMSSGMRPDPEKDFLVLPDAVQWEPVVVVLKGYGEEGWLESILPELRAVHDRQALHMAVQSPKTAGAQRRRL